MKQFVLITTILILVFGCASKIPSADEQLVKAFEKMEETNSTGIIYQQQQSHGLIGDAIHKILHPGKEKVILLQN